MARTKPRTSVAVPTELVIAPDDPHYNIPRDADGLPIFFILEPDVQRDYDRKMMECERGWSATRDPGFVKQAQIWLHIFRQPSPLWLSEAIIAVCERRQNKGHVAHAIRAAIRLMRYRAVCDAPKPGTYDIKTGQRITWNDAYNHAVQKLARSPARAGWRTMKADYQQVKRDFDQGRGGLYDRPLPTFGRKLRDVLNGKHRPAGIKS
jgi:hypothetical protein